MYTGLELFSSMTEPITGALTNSGLLPNRDQRSNRDHSQYDKFIVSLFWGCSTVISPKLVSFA